MPDAPVPTIHYELTNHLGNVMAVITDEPATTETPAVESLADYYPFGMTMPGRSYNAHTYRHGFTGHEKENDLAEGIYTTEYRLYDARVGRWLSIDPLFEKYVGMSPYNYCMLNPAMMVDPDGKAVETLWDLANVGIGIESFNSNVSSGNYLDATLDGLGVVADMAAVAIPGIPGGAGILIKASRATKTFVFSGRSFKSVSRMNEYKALFEKFGKNVAEALWDSRNSNKLRKACNADPEEQAHHIIPRELIDESETLREAIDDGFDFNGAINGIALKKDRHNGSHPDYTEMVRGLIEQAKNNPKFKSAKEKMEWVANNMRDRIENSNGKINNKTVE
jgi:RHS repeat-associated protein